MGHSIVSKPLLCCEGSEVQAEDQRSLIAKRFENARYLAVICLTGSFVVAVECDQESYWLTLIFCVSHEPLAVLQRFTCSRCPNL